MLSTLPHPSPGFAGAGLEMDEVGNLWLIDQSPNTVYLIDSGVPAFVDVPWISESPTSGIVAPGATQEIQVTVDTTGLQPGAYNATLFIATNSGRQPQLQVPVRLTVPASYSFFTVTPCRLADTRNPPGPFGGPALSNGVVRTFTVGGNCGVPAAAGAVSVNLTVVGATGSGHLTLYSADVPAPNTSNINFTPGLVRANNAVLTLSAEAAGRIAVLPVVTGNGQVHLIVDVNGYFQ